MNPHLGTTPLTHSATLRRLLYEALTELGHDPVTIYRRTNQNRRLVPPPTEGRLSHDEAPLFWLAADALTGDPDIGLHLGEVMKPRLLDVVGYLLLSSRDLQQAVDSFLRFQHILAGGFVAQLCVEDERACLVLDLNYRGFGPLRQQMECLALLFIKLLRLITDDEFHIDGLDFRHPRPARVSEHRRLLGLLPRFAAEHDALWFPAALLRRPSRNANPGLHRLLWQHAETQLAELVENDLLNRLSYLIGVRLGRADCSLRACAAELGMPPAPCSAAWPPRAATCARYARRSSSPVPTNCCARAWRSATWRGPAASPSCRPSTGRSAAGTASRRMPIGPS